MKSLTQNVLMMAIAILQAGCLSLHAADRSKTSPRIISMRITDEYFPARKNDTEVSVEMCFHVQKTSLVDKYPNHYLVEVAIDGQPFRKVLHQHIRRPWGAGDLEEHSSGGVVRMNWQFQLNDELARPKLSIQLRLTYPSGEPYDNRAMQWATENRKALWTGTLITDIMKLTEDKAAPTSASTATNQSALGAD